MNTSVEFFRIIYELVSFVEYVGRLPKNPLHNELVAHYIGYRCIIGQWIHNDDALIHLTDVKGEYKVNIAIYRGLQCSPLDRFFINDCNIPYWLKMKVI